MHSMPDFAHLEHDGRLSSPGGGKKGRWLAAGESCMQQAVVVVVDACRGVYEYWMRSGKIYT